MSERKVIKIPQQTQTETPSIGDEDFGEDDELNMNDNGEMPQIGMNDGGDTPNNGSDSEFDTNFDAGVEADETTDPKKYIQQLTGKLSQSLRSYNGGLPQPDADLDKYVAGMIVSQAIDGLSQDDRAEILKKIDSGESIEEPSDEESGEDNELEMGDNGQENANGTDISNDIENVGESKHRFNGKSLDEIFNQTLRDTEDSVNQQQTKPIKNIGFKKKPFTSPNFK